MKTGVALAAFALVFSTAFAQTQAGPATDGYGARHGSRRLPGAVDGTPPGLQPKSDHGIAYLCGGIGEDEAKQMKRQANGYSLMLTFAASDGAYLADVGVQIKDAGGRTVLQTVCDAPILLANLPGGRYRIHAEAGGYPVDRKVRISPERRRGPAALVVLRWPRQAEGTPGAMQSGGGESGLRDEDRHPGGAR
jgi:hypothetical protein